VILVTGVSGFIGKHLLKELVREFGKSAVVALSSGPVKECPYLLHQQYQFDRTFFIKSGYASIETVIHAFTPKNASQANDWNRCNSNIINTGNLLAADFPSLKKFIYLSTLDVYANDDVISEQSPVGPASLYGQSKLYCEKMITAWAEPRQIILQLLRVGHVYGPGEESYQKIIPTAFKKILTGQPLQVWGSGREIRSFIYIDDLVQAVIQSLNLAESAGPVNLVSRQKITIRNLLEKIIDITGKTVSIEAIPAQFPGRDYIFDNEKMRALLPLSETALDKGLREEWRYMQQGKHEDIF